MVRYRFDPVPVRKLRTLRHQLYPLYLILNRAVPNRQPAINRQTSTWKWRFTIFSSSTRTRLRSYTHISCSRASTPCPLSRVSSARIRTRTSYSERLSSTRKKMNRNRDELLSFTTTMESCSKWRKKKSRERVIQCVNLMESYWLVLIVRFVSSNGPMRKSSGSSAVISTTS
uniref:Uncharacterized protein n=1 Tax=Cacopsylla melanoneura TaxID=428564 RepID=A0A8D9AQW9_9HEMI